MGSPTVTFCPGCGVQNNYMTGVTKGEDGGFEEQVCDGAFVLCSTCNAFGVFEKDEVRWPTCEEIAGFVSQMQNDPVLRRAMLLGGLTIASWRQDQLTRQARNN